MRNITYICKKNLPMLNLKVGQKFVVEANSEQDTFFSQTPEYFTRVLNESECWHADDPIIFTGRATNITHPNRNRNTLGRGEYITKAFGHIISVNPHKTDDTCDIRFKTLGGIEYKVENISIIVEECTSDRPTSKPDIIRTEEYYFINSRGMICQTFAGKDTVADDWRLLVGNYFKQVEQAHAYKDSIITTSTMLNDCDL